MNKPFDVIENWSDFNGLRIKSYFSNGFPAYTIYYTYPSGKRIVIRAMVGYKNTMEAKEKAELYITNFNQIIQDKIAKWQGKYNKPKK